jgi:hypothetical protein
MDGREIMAALIQRGYTPVQAAALSGNMAQESGYDPTNVNAKEGAHGVLQWRMDRWDNLRKFAAERGTSPTDLPTQMDFIGHEMSNNEAKAGSEFRAATDLPSAQAALKSYVRWGDKSDQVRLNYARGLLGQGPSTAAPMQSVPATAGANPASSPAAPGQPEPPQPQAPDLGIADAISAISKQTTQDTPAPIAIEPAQAMALPQMVRARQLAAAMLAKQLNPEQA